MQRKKIKLNIIFILILIAFFSWIYMGPAFLSEHFHELEESYIEKYKESIPKNKTAITYVVDKFELKPNSYREIVEISGFAFKEMKPEIKKRNIFIILESENKKNNYIVKSQLMQRPQVLGIYLPNQDIRNYTHVGYYGKFSAIGVKNGNYKVNILVEENDNRYYSDIKFILKKDRGMITILPIK